VIQSGITHSRKRGDNIMSAQIKKNAKNRKAEITEIIPTIEVKLVKVSKGVKDFCTVCTAKALELSSEVIESLHNLDSKAGLNQLKAITGNDIMKRVSTQWNRIEVLNNTSHHDFWMCSSCARSVSTAKSTLPEIFPVELMSKIKK
jgi:hypothetical protein